MLGLAARVRADGTPLSGRTIAILQALNAAADQPSSAPGTSQAPAATIDLSASEAADLLGCSAEYVRRLVRKGRLDARRIGTVWIIDRASLERFRGGVTHDGDDRQQ